MILAWQRFRMDTGRIGVRKLPVGVLGSVVVHATLGALVYAYMPERRPEPEITPVTVELVDIVPVPARPPAVVLAEPPPEPPPPRAAQDVPPPEPPIARAAPQPPRAEISTGARAAVETAPPAAGDPGAAPPSRSAWFDLRRRRAAAVDLRLPQGSHDDLDRVPRGTDAAPGVARTGQLRDAGGGSYRSEQGPFTAKVAPDGSVTLKDGRNLQVGLALPTPRSVANGVSRWYYSDKGADGQRGDRALDKEVSGSTDAEDRSKTAVLPVLRGGFDITDAFMRRKGNDPYASKKLAFLDSTRDERVQLGTAHREQQLRQTAQIMRRNLDQLWQQLAEPRARRAALFELWDEAVETGDANVVEAGRAARRLVIGFIRARLPAGGPDAYTADELAGLNRHRQSKASFEPYE
jgi:hypothetical protein